MRRLPSLAAIRAFEAAARHENFTSAADELGMTQAAVSYQIKSLEGAVGLPLFLRERGRVSLTEAGAHLAGQVTAAFDLLDDAFLRLRDEDEAMLHVCSFLSFSMRWLAVRLGGFQVAHAGLAVRLHVEDGLSDFVRDNIDVSIRGGGGEWPGMHSQFLMRVLHAPMASPAFVAAQGPFDTPASIQQGRLLSPDDIWWARWFSKMGVTDPPPAQPGIRMDSQTIEGNAALAGQGIGMLNPVFWQEELAAGRLVQLGEAVYSSSSFWVVCPEHKRNQPKVKLFRDWIIAEAERDPMHEAIRMQPRFRTKQG